VGLVVCSTGPSQQQQQQRCAGEPEAVQQQLQPWKQQQQRGQVQTHLLLQLLPPLVINQINQQWQLMLPKPARMQSLRPLHHL
jgi:hypothetical protein